MKHLKPYENNQPTHNPKHKYDCENCKFNWCCGFECNCKLFDVPDAHIGTKYEEYIKLKNTANNYNL